MIQKIAIIKNKWILLVIPTLFALNITTCSSCPLSGTCPIHTTVTFSLSAVFSYYLSKIYTTLKNRKKFLKRKLVPLLILAMIIILLFSAISNPGSDRLTVSPNRVQIYEGESAKIIVRVDFAHKQPCPYPDWKITYETEGGVRVLSASQPQISSTGKSVTMTITITGEGNGSLLIVYTYGTRCPFGDEETARVDVVVFKKQTRQTSETTRPVNETETGVKGGLKKPPSESGAPFYIVLLQRIYDYRGVVLLFVASFSIVYVVGFSKWYSDLSDSKRREFLWKRKKHLSKVREIVSLLLLMTFIFIPVYLSGSICPCMIGGLQEGILAFMGETILDVFNNLYLEVFVITVVSSILVRRIWCGWICPFGVLQDYLAKIHGKLRVPANVEKYLLSIKYAVLSFIILMVILSVSHWFCFYSCPILAFTQAIYTLSFIPSILLLAAIIIIIGNIFVPRFFCRYLCPTGALLEILAILKINIFKLKPTEKCRDCGICSAVAKECPMGLKYPGSYECISCGKCIEKCPFGAIAIVQFKKN